MTSAVIGALRVTLGLNSAQFTSGLTAAQQQLRQTSTRFQSVAGKMAGIGAAMSLAITTPFIAAGAHLLQGSQDAAAASAQVQAALTSMGAASGKTLEGLQATAEGLRNLTGVDDDEILKKVTANLLTFGNVSGDVFDRAQVAIVDISARLGTDLQSATMMVGKALNDPIKGLGALRKTGIQFTEQQEAQIKAMVGAGNAAGAQAIMLAELERQFGGAAKAAADADIWTPLRTALMDLEGAFEPIIRNVVAPAIAAAAQFAKAFAALPTPMIAFVAVAAAVAAAIGPILVGIAGVVSAVGTIGAAIAGGGMVAAVASFAVAAAPFIAAAAAIGIAVYAFRDDLAPILSAFGKAVMDAIGPAIPPLMVAARTAFNSFVETMKTLIAVVGPILADIGGKLIETFGPIIITGLRLFMATVTSVFQVVSQALRVVAALLKGDWQGAWNAAGSLVMASIQGIGRIVEAIFPGILGSVRRLVTGVQEWFSARLNDILMGVINKVRAVGDAFFKLYDAVVGHSYVPDMVVEVGQWMDRLDELMVDPATAATEKTADRFKRMGDQVRATIGSLLTDAERDARELSRIMADLDWGLANGRITQAEHTEFARRATNQYGPEEVLTELPSVQLRPLDEDGRIARFQEAWRETQQKIADEIAASREKFANSFAYGIEAALNGDWASVLRTIVEEVFGGTLQDALRNLGGSLFDSMGGGKGGGINLGSIAKGIGSLFGKIPGFATGGSFKVGGSGGIDSKLVSMRLTPGEMVDVRRPGQLREPGSNVINFDLRGAVTTADLLGQMQGMATQSGGNALRTARTAVPADRAKRDRYALGRR